MNLRRQILGLSLVLSASASLMAQTAPKAAPAAGNAYEINVGIKDYTGNKVVLAFQLGEKTYVKDTVDFVNGKATFKGAEELPGGLYMVLMPPDNKFFQMLVSKGEQKMTFETSGPDYVGNMKLKGSKDNQAFYDYMNFLSGMNKKATPIRAQVEASKNKPESAEYKAAQDGMKAMDDEVKAYQKNMVTTNPNYLSSKIVQSNMALDIPQPKKADGVTLDTVAQFKWYKKHFFDGFDWADERMVRTDILQKKMMTWVGNLAVQHPDSICVAVDYIMESARKNKEVFKYCASELLNYYAATKVICMDAVYVYIADKYYCSPNAPYGAFWVEKEQLAKICDNAAELRGVRCNQVAPDLVLTSLEGKPVRLSEVKSPITVVYFWDPDCGNCKKMSERMVALWDELKFYGVEVYGICSKGGDDYPKCAKKVEEMKMPWINTGDPGVYALARAKQAYDIKMTPYMYMLDKDKKIIYKHIDGDQLRDIARREFEKGKKNPPKFPNPLPPLPPSDDKNHGTEAPGAH